MYIKNLQLTNYKGFKSCNVDFHPRLNVLIGSNASGKTTLLSGLLKLICSLIEQFAPFRGDREAVALSQPDINYGATFCYLEMHISDFAGYPKDVELFLLRRQIASDQPPNLDKKQSDFYAFTNWYRTLIQNATHTVPIFKFYPANRGSIKYSDYNINDAYIISQLEAWSNIYQDSISFSKFFKWFFDHETNELRLQRDAQDFNIESPDLKGVRLALKKAFELLAYGNVNISTKQIKRPNTSKLTPTLVIENIDTNKIDELENKSDGEKAIITLIADIAYNLSLAKDFTLDDNFLSSSGTVIIDEIESHLHPNWQRAIIPILLKVFPNIQFFIATHSPQVVSSVKSESVFVLQDFQVNKVELKTKGEDTNTLLKYIFNSTERPKEYIDLIQKFYTLIDEKAEYKLLNEVLAEIDAIEKQDKATDINSLLTQLRLELDAYKFDREYEANN